MRFPLDCHLEKELSLILFDLYKKNTNLEVGDLKLTWLGFLKGISSSIKKTVNFYLPPIKEEEKGIELKLNLNLIEAELN